MRDLKLYLLFLIIGGLLASCVYLGYQLVKCEEKQWMSFIHIKEFDEFPIPEGAKVDPSFISSSEKTYLIKYDYEDLCFSYIVGLVSEGWKVESTVSMATLKVEKDNMKYRLIIERAESVGKGLCRISVNPVE
jgi:hypothetical protein